MKNLESLWVMKVSVPLVLIFTVITNILKLKRNYRLTAKDFGKFVRHKSPFGMLGLFKENILIALD